MFKWVFGRKTQQAKRTEPFASRFDNNPIKNDAFDYSTAIKKSIDIYFTSNAHASILYAKAAGYQEETIDFENIEAFMDFVNKNHHALQGEDAELAKEWFERQLEYVLKSDLWEHFFFSATEYNVDKDGYSHVSKLHDKLKSANLQELYGPNTETIGVYALSKAISRKREDLDMVFNLLEEKKIYLKPLFSKAIASGKNKYGEIDFTKYYEEITDFFDYFLPDEKWNFYFSSKPYSEVVDYLELWFQSSSADTTTIPDDGIEFEYWCAEKLQQQGWSATVSQASGDQGVDIELCKDDFVVAVQCKRYSKPIGNKAVQEIFAGAKNISADAAAVIGTGGFTKSARELSITTSVELFDASEIEYFSERFNFENNDAQINKENNFEIHFKSEPQRMLALLFRTVLGQFDAHDLMLNQNFKQHFFDRVDETGRGVMSFTPKELSSLMIYAGPILNAKIELSPESVISLEKHDYPNLEVLKTTSLNAQVRISDLYGDELATELKAEFLSLASQLPKKINLDDHVIMSL